MNAIPQEICFQMEEFLMEDDLVDQVKIIDLANLDSPEQDLIVAVSLSDVEAQHTPMLATAAVKAIQKELIRNMAPYGGKEIVPSRWARPQELPVRANGEVDTFALRRQLLLSAHQEEEGIAPSAPVQPIETVEKKVLRIVADALGIESKDIVMEKSFSENGGDSFTAINITGRLMMEGISLRVPDIVGAQTLAELRSRVVSRHDGEAAAAAPVAVAAAPARRESIVLQTMPRRDSIGFQPTVRRDSCSLRRGSLAAQSMRRPSVVQ